MYINKKEKTTNRTKAKNCNKINKGMLSIFVDILNGIKCPFAISSTSDICCNLPCVEITEITIQSIIRNHSASLSFFYQLS